MIIFANKVVELKCLTSFLIINDLKEHECASY